MKIRLAPVLALGLFAASVSPDTGPKSITGPESQVSWNGAASELNLGQHDGPADAHVHHIRGFDASAASSNANPNGQARVRSPNMTNHGGKIMTTAKAIFRGTSWATYSGDKMTGIDAFYAG